ncbi:hypothetical protein OXX59_002639 [Metschnikowia pulcherrima]
MESDAALVEELLVSLHALHQFSASNITSFETLLLQVWAQITQLLDAPGEQERLHISSNVFSDFDVYTRKETSETFLASDVTTQSILLYIENGADASLEDNDNYNSRLSAAQSVLGQKLSARLENNVERSNSVVPSLEELVSTINTSCTTAEENLREYLLTCFLYDIRQSASEPKNASNSFSEDVDTEKLMSAIDDPTYSKAEHNSLTQRDSSSDLACSDSHVMKIYHVFLQLALHEIPPETREDVAPYVDVMLGFYKKHRHITTFESLEDAAKDELIIEFLCGSDLHPGIVPPKFKAHAVGILTSGIYDNDPQDPSVVQIPHEVPISQTSTHREFTRQEIQALVTDFETVISTLSEYDPHLDPALLPAFRNYVSFVYDEFPEVPVFEDFEFINVVAESILAVVNYVASDEDSESDTIEDILLSICGIQDTLSDISSSSTLLMRLTVSETQNSRAFARSCLLRWNRKTLVANQLRIIYEEEFLPQSQRRMLGSTFSKWYGKSSALRLLSSEAAMYSKKKQMSHHFNNCWINSMIKVIDLNSALESFTKKKYMAVWREKMNKCEELESQADLHQASKCVSRQFGRWRVRLGNVSNLEKIADEVGDGLRSGSDLFLRGKIWENWKQRLDESSEKDTAVAVEPLSVKLSNLNNLSRHFILKKYLLILKSRSANGKALAVFHQSRNLFLKHHFFSVWQMKKELSKLRETVVYDRELALKRSAFNCWCDQTRSKISADVTMRRNLLQKSWKTWKTRKLAARFESVSASNVKRDYLKRWLLRARSVTITKESDMKALKVMVAKWKQRAIKVLDDEELAKSTCAAFAVANSLVIWKSKLAAIEEWQSVADLHVQQKFLNKIVINFTKVQDQNRKAQEYEKQEHQFADRLQLRATLRKWQDVYLLRYEHEASQALAYFQSNVRNAGTLSVFFNSWKGKYERLKENQILLDKNLMFFNNTNILKSEFFLHWIDVTRANVSAADKSVDFHRALLHKKFLLAWYEKYITKARYLSEIADEFISRREYTRMIEILRKWNLAFTKNVRRNQQTCDMFVEKWERNNLKSLFELWHYKARKRVPIEDDYAEANTTFGSNTSPLSKKFLGSGASLEYLDGASYLYTPVKKQVSRLPFTPAKASSSPTRLQETNQKMKSTKMDALTSRYKLAKGDNANARSQTRLVRTNSTSLPPPLSPSRLPIRPPPAPRFDTSSDTRAGPDAASSPESSSVSSQVLPYAGTENRVVETAKRLQRIRPLVVPNSGGTTEIRYSPVSKLRERLQSRAEALKSPSDMF